MQALLLSETLDFDPAAPDEALRPLPSRKAVFALYGADELAKPYIGVTPDLRRRLKRLLQPATTQTRRLQLVSRIQRIAWQATGSEFESLLVQFRLLEHYYGPKALERMHLRMPTFVRFHGGNSYPRLTVTNRLSKKDADWAFGPFPSRAAAERYSEELLKLFLLRRCQEDLDPNPSHPGCAYSEMKMCLAPCYKGCTDERYANEAKSVQSFLATRGESKLTQIRMERDHASENLEFESAAKLHAQFEKVEAIRGLAPELVHPLNELHACIFQASGHPDEVAVFLYKDGSLRGPAAFSTVGMRIQNEQSGSSSLFAQPMALEPIPEAGSPQPQTTSRDVLQSRLEGALESLSGQQDPPNPTMRQGHLALLTRWYYRPQQKRIGEVCFPASDKNADGTWPIKAMLRSIGRVAASTLPRPIPMAGTLEVVTDGSENAHG